MNIVPRSEWGARPPKSRSTITTPTPRLWLHHAATVTFGVPAVRAHQRYHMDVKGWADIGYSFLVDRDGTVYEGRGAGVAGAHTGGDNSTSHGICLLGNWNDVPPPDAQLDGTAALVAYGYGQGWWPDTITGGHRDAPGAVTTCPGRADYRDINRRLAKVSAASVENTVTEEEMDRIAYKVWAFKGKTPNGVEPGPDGLDPDDAYEHLRDTHRRVRWNDLDTLPRVRRGLRALLGKAGVTLPDGP